MGTRDSEVHTVSAVKHETEKNIEDLGMNKGIILKWILKTEWELGSINFLYFPY